jgi:hypothetical protein
LWNSTYVDFGSFDEVVNHAHPQDPISFSIEFSADSLRNRIDTITSYLGDPLPGKLEKLSYSSTLTRGTRGRTKFSSCRLNINDEIVDLNFHKTGRMSGISMNGTDIKTIVPKLTFQPINRQFLPSFDLGNFSNRYNTADTDSYIYLASSAISSENPEIARATLVRLVRVLPLVPRNQFAGAIQRAYDVILQRDMRTYQRTRATPQASLQLSDKLLSAVFEMRFIHLLPVLCDIIYTDLITEGSTIQYVGPLRASAERYYRVQELAIDDIDPSGSNVAMYLHYLSPTQLRRFNGIFADAFGFSITPSSSAGHVSLMLRNAATGEKENIVDVGFGFSQVLPIIAQIHAASSPAESGVQRPISVRMISSSPIVALEQPELHLHPAYQAKLADLFAALVTPSDRRRPFRFVIETHSEAFVNRLGWLVGRGSIPAESIAIYTFEKLLASHTSVKELEFDSRGLIDEWPVGFLSP